MDSLAPTFLFLFKFIMKVKETKKTINLFDFVNKKPEKKLE